METKRASRTKKKAATDSAAAPEIETTSVSTDNTPSDDWADSLTGGGDLGYEVEDAGDILGSLDADMLAPIGLQSLIIRRGESALIRPITKQVVRAKVHWMSTPGPDGGRPELLRCNGRQCVFCMAGKQASDYLLAPVFSIGDGDIRVLSMPRTAGPNSLAPQLLSILATAGFEKLILQIRRHGNRYRVAVANNLDDQDSALQGVELGEDIIRDFLATDAGKPELLLASIEQRPNQMLLMDYPSLRAEIAVLHPGLDMSKL